MERPPSGDVGGDDLAIDSQMRIRVDRSKFKVNVTQFDPPTIMVIGAKGPVMTFSHAYGIDPVSVGLTELSLTGSLGRVLGSLMGVFSTNRMRRDLRDELAPIKEAAETTIS